MKKFITFLTLIAAFMLPQMSLAYSLFDFDSMDHASSDNNNHDGDITGDGETFTVNGVSVTVSAKTSGNTENRFWGASPRLRCYSGTITVTASEPITTITFDANTNFNLTVDKGTLTDKVWTGSATTVVFTVTKNTQIRSIAVQLNGEAAPLPELPEAANIAAFKALSANTEAILTLTNAQVNKVSGNNVYIQDATGGLLLYNTGLTFEEGTILNGKLIGKITTYQNMPEFIAGAYTNRSEITATATETLAAIDAQIKGLATEANIYQLYTIKGVQIVKDEENKYYAVDGENRIQIYDQFKVNPTYPEYATLSRVILGYYNNNYQLYPLTAEDIVARTTITIDTDVTAQFGALTLNTNWRTGAGGTAGYTSTEFCPKVVTNAGQEVQVCEFYEASCERTGDMLYQTVTGLSAGTYRIELYGAAAFTFDRGFQSAAFETTGNGTNSNYSAGDHIDTNTGVTLYAETSEGTYGSEIPIYYATNFPNGAATVVLENVVVGANGSVKIGMKKTSKSTNWHVIQLKGVTATVNADDALAAVVERANAIDGTDVPETLYAALQEAVETYNKSYDTAEGYTEAIDAINAAIDAVQPFIIAKPVLDKMKELVDATNVYTEEAYEEYYGQWVQKYDDLTLTMEEARGLEDPFVITDWRGNVKVDNFLLSAWDTNPDFNNAPYYINTWSTEGENDGTEFKVPFFEYWTGDGESLGARTLTATMEGLDAGTYDVTAWVRVRAKNGVAAADATGITLVVNEGDAVDVTEGETLVGQFNVGEYTATGVVGDDGVLKIQFVVADANISWLSFKNVKFAKQPTYLDFEECTATTAMAVRTYDYDATDKGGVAQLQPVDGWNIVENGNARAGAVFTYGSASLLGGEGYPTPLVGPTGAENHALGVVGVWTGLAQYTRDVTFAAGKYVITLPVFNSEGGTSEFEKNLMGVTINGTEHYVATKSYAANVWKYETITLDVEEAAAATLSLGYKAANAGSGAMPHLFIDEVNIKTFESDEARDAYLATVPTMEAKANLVYAIAKAQAAVEENVAVGDLFITDVDALSAAIVPAQAVLDNAESTKEQYEEAAASLNISNFARKYTFQLKADEGLYMTLNGGTKLTNEAVTLSFQDMNGNVAITNGAEYVAYTGTGDNVWSMGASANPYAWKLTKMEDGYYTIAKAANTAHFIGVDDVSSGASCYADKKEANEKSLWKITEVVAMYTITVAETENGTVTADKETAFAGELVTLTVTPAEGYKLVELTVTTGETAVELTEDNTFKMPAGDVTVTATFILEEPESPCLKTYDLSVTDVALGDYTAETLADADIINEAAGLLNATPEELTFQLVNADGTVDTEYNGNPDEVLFWVTSDGQKHGWDNGNEAKYFVKYDVEVPAILVFQYGAVYEGQLNAVVRLANAAGQYVEFNISETMMAKPEINVESVVKTIELAYSTKANTKFAVENPDLTFSVDEVCEALGIEDINEAQAYIVNVTFDEDDADKYVENLTDGWRDANGDAAYWGTEGGLCLKLNYPASGQFDYIGSYDDTLGEGDHILQWALVADGKAVILQVTITFYGEGGGTGINGLTIDTNAANIYDLQGRKVQNVVKGQIYIVNGKKVMVK